MEKILSIITTIAIILSIVEIAVISFKFINGKMEKKKFIPYLLGGILIIASSIISKVIL